MTYIFRCKDPGSDTGEAVVVINTQRIAFYAAQKILFAHLDRLGRADLKSKMIVDFHNQEDVIYSSVQSNQPDN